MKKNHITAALIATSLAAVSMSSSLTYAGWSDALKDVVKNEDVQKVLDKVVESDTPGKVSNLSTETVIEGLKEALEVGSRRAIKEISQPNGYLNNQKIRIPLPDKVNSVMVK